MTLGGIPMNENYMDLLTHYTGIGHTTHSHSSSHSAEHETMHHNQADDHNAIHFTAHNMLNTDDDLDRQIAEAAAAQSSYDEWKTQLTADCHASGIAFPSSYALQRAWNAEQKKRAEQRKQDKKKDVIRARIAQLQSLLGDAKKELAAQEEQLPDFDALDNELLRIQQQREIAAKEAARQQSEIFQLHPDEGTKLHYPDDL
jgi:hypothetical protein